ncbi:hypothetical protein [Paractinoplanes hotanensis]|nr:hypothetical protein [Actinoplanes hotanensis]
MIYLGGGGSEHDESKLWDEVFRPGSVTSCAAGEAVKLGAS